MAKIAVDVVLLPSDGMMGRAIEINRELLKRFENKIILDKEKCLPHISLAMGCINEEDLPEIKEILASISSRFPQMNLVAEGIHAEVTPTGRTVSGLIVKKTDEIQRLHEAVMKRVFPYLSYGVKVEMLFNPEEAEEVTLYWIKNYYRHHDNPGLFHPHITVGFGETDRFAFPVEFSASRLALCQLGNYCTCRKVLFSTGLES